MTGPGLDRVVVPVLPGLTISVPADALPAAAEAALAAGLSRVHESLRVAAASVGQALRPAAESLQQLMRLSTGCSLVVEATVTLPNGVRIFCPAWRVKRDPWRPLDRRHLAGQAALCIDGAALRRRYRARRRRRG